MGRYLFKRFGMMLLTLFVILTLGFLVIRLMPGSPFDDPNYSAEMTRMLEEKHHLHEPIIVQYYYYLKDIITGGYWGVSLNLEPMTPVWTVIGRRIPVTLTVNFLSLLIALPLGILAGTWAALYRNKWPDHVISLLTVLFISVPSFVMASLLQYFLGYKAGLFPLIYDATGTEAVRLTSLVMPVLALSFHPIAMICRHLRGELAENMRAEYMITAQAKGLSLRQAVFRHAFRNSLIPVMNIIVPLFTNILAGSLVIERIFGIPGVGGLMTRSINAKDHWLTITVLFFYAMIHLVTVLVTDISYGLIDPRIRLGGDRDD
ncbi:MAG: ABC transporter permease [Lachnospiraceae bacterium]|nr:ABC transporter permease [Lachnospiraceae bacterium]